MSRQTRSTLIAELGAAFRAHQRAVEALDDAAALLFGVNRTDLRCLDVLLEHERTTPGALATALGLTSGSVTVVLDRLERAGYAERRPDPTDRRRTLVLATPNAVARAETVYGPLVADGAPALARYPVPVLRAFLEFLQEDRARQEAHAARVRALATGRADAAPADTAARRHRARDHGAGDGRDVGAVAGRRATRQASPPGASAAPVRPPRRT